MDIGTAQAERTDASPARPVTVGFPRGEAGVDVKGAVGQVNFRVGRVKVEAGRDKLVVQGQSCFDQARDAGSAVEVAEVADSFQPSAVNSQPKMGAAQPRLRSADS